MEREDGKRNSTGQALVASDDTILGKMGAEHCERGERESHGRNRRRQNKGCRQQQRYHHSRITIKSTGSSSCTVAVAVEQVGAHRRNNGALEPEGPAAG